MQLYEQLLHQLKSLAEPEYAAFQSKLLVGDFNVLGVRIPVLRKLAKEYYPRIEEVLEFPDEYYEVKFIKLICASMLPYGEFVKIVNYCATLIDNWALCDCFIPACIKANKKDFLNYIQKYLNKDAEFYQRFALTTLLHFYVEGEYLPIIFKSVLAADTDYYYVRIAAAWLIAEVLVKHFEEGVSFLKQGLLDKPTHNKSIQKACESFRVTEDKKVFLKGLKR